MNYEQAMEYIHAVQWAGHKQRERLKMAPRALRHSQRNEFSFCQWKRLRSFPIDPVPEVGTGNAVAAATHL